MRVDDRSPSPPSRSQPLRALVTCGGYFIDKADAPLHQDRDSCEHHDVSFYAAAQDGDQQYRAEGFHTPRREGSLGEEKRTEGRDKEGGGGGAIPTAASPSSLPRVADLEGVHRRALEKKKARAAEAAALVRCHHRSGCNGDGSGDGASSTREPHGRHRGTATYYPSWYDPNHADSSAPDSGLALEYVHGYAGETPDVLGNGVGGGGGGGEAGGGHRCGKSEDSGCGGGTFGGGAGPTVVPGRVGGARRSATRSTNVMWLRSGEIVFPAAAVVVIHDFETNRQRFFTGHDEASFIFSGHDEASLVIIIPLFDTFRR